MTAADLVRRSGRRLVIGNRPAYDWSRDCIILPQEIANGTDAYALLLAAHEVAHARQPLWSHFLRWLRPVRWWQEKNAWETGVEMVKGYI